MRSELCLGKGKVLIQPCVLTDISSSPFKILPARKGQPISPLLPVKMHKAYRMQYLNLNHSLYFNKTKKFKNLSCKRSFRKNQIQVNLYSIKVFKT